MEEEKLIEEILKHLDQETRMGVVRMSVEMKEKDTPRRRGVPQMLQYVRPSCQRDGGAAGLLYGQERRQAGQ